MAKDVADIAVEAAPQVVDQVFAIPLADIAVGERQRPVDPVWAGALGRIMATEGGVNRTPIEVCRLPGRSGFTLVAGGHRLEGARLEGWGTIRAVIVSSDAIQRRMAEISENLWRRNLSPIDRAAAVAELIHLKKVQAGIDPARDGRTVSAKARWSERLKEDAEDASATIALAYGWAEDAAEVTGLSRRSIYLDLELHQGLRPAVIEQLRGLPISNNAAQLRALAKLPEADQRLVAEMIFQGTAKGATDAVALLRQTPKPSPAKKALSAFIGSWGRMSAREQRLALRELKLPKGVTITFEGDSDA